MSGILTDDPCELYCTDSDDTVIVPWGDSAADGTPCNIGTNDMCIAGICKVRDFCCHVLSISCNNNRSSNV